MWLQMRWAFRLGNPRALWAQARLVGSSRFALSYHWKLTIPLSYEHHTYHTVQKPLILHCFETARIFNDEQSLSRSIPQTPPTLPWPKQPLIAKHGTCAPRAQPHHAPTAARRSSMCSSHWLTPPSSIRAPFLAMDPGGGVLPSSGVRRDP